ncbi:MAG: hypothetical protein ABWZ40_10875, partial [Caulobacterales bacterium]
MDQPEQTLEQTQDDFEFLRTLANMCARQFGRPADLMQKLISPRDHQFLRVSIRGLEALARRLLLILASQLSIPPLSEKARARIATPKAPRKPKHSKGGQGANEAPLALPADLPLTDGVMPDRI